MVNFVQSADVPVALRAWLSEQSAVTTLCPATRMYLDEIPIYGLEDMPTNTLMIALDGGLPDNTYLPVSQTGITIYSYGNTSQDARTLALTTEYTLKYMTKNVQLTAILFGAVLSTGILPRHDSDLKQSFFEQSFIVSAGYVQIPPAEEVHSLERDLSYRQYEYR